MKVGLLDPQCCSFCQQNLWLMSLSIVMHTMYEAHGSAGYIGLGAYFDGENYGGQRLRQSQPVVMRIAPLVTPKTSWQCMAGLMCTQKSPFQVPTSGQCCMQQGNKTMELLVASDWDGTPIDVVRYAAELHPQD